MEELVSPVVLSHSILGLLRVQNEADGCKADDVYIRPGLRARSASQQGESKQYKGTATYPRRSWISPSHWHPLHSQAERQSRHA